MSKNTILIAIGHLSAALLPVVLNLTHPFRLHLHLNTFHRKAQILQRLPATNHQRIHSRTAIVMSRVTD